MILGVEDLRSFLLGNATDGDGDLFGDLEGDIFGDGDLSEDLFLNLEGVRGLFLGDLFKEGDLCVDLPVDFELVLLWEVGVVL